VYAIESECKYVTAHSLSRFPFSLGAIIINQNQTNNMQQKSNQRIFPAFPS
jgi:hypothetical protein